MGSEQHEGRGGGFHADTLARVGGGGVGQGFLARHVRGTQYRGLVAELDKYWYATLCAL